MWVILFIMCHTSRCLAEHWSHSEMNRIQCGQMATGQSLERKQMYSGCEMWSNGSPSLVAAV